ncbi:MAG: ELM1/GtrOC1 family putative glycosyltransferase [Verrucomicrobia bacterium]|nr:ELM1/GtrOC1 family putative glycosyltransferase [Verrucomicrobiota bacterium]
MSALRHIRVLSDGRPGHENQSVGLALALARRTGASCEVVKLDPAAGVWARMRAATAEGNKGRKPQLVIAAGHRTHLPLWWAARKFGARSVVIMKPSLPLAFFDLALVPRHDVAEGAADTVRRILTRGALNRVPEVLPTKEPVGLVLIGGPSKHHGWDGEALVPCIARVVAAQPDLSWTVADSRRTPEGFLAGLELPSEVRVSKVPHQRTGPGWLAGELAKARVVWATEDSVSMVHEAVTAGAATGVLPAPARGRAESRVLRAVDGLVAAGYATGWSEWERNGVLRVGQKLQESARCAEEIIERWFGSETQK